MDLKDILKAFNRKERSWLIRDALGAASNCLGAEFCERIVPEVRRLHPDFAFDSNPYWATDFHFDWLVGALHLLNHPNEPPRTPQPNSPELVTGTQEDIDLIIATGNTLLLIEAKGEGAWSNSQLSSKIDRLKAMTPILVNSDGWAGPIRMAFLSCSPRGAPPNVSTSGWPDWAKPDGHPLHFELKRPAASFYAVSRSTDTKPDMFGKQWIVREIDYSEKADAPEMH